MRRWLPALWFVGLLLALAGCWLIWTRAAVPDVDLRFAASLLPLILWAMIPMVFRSALGRSQAAVSPNLRSQRRAARAFLSERGLRARRARYAVPFYLVTGPSGVGKSSLLERSELGLGEPVTIGSATWWAGRDAVFIETSSGASEAGVRETAEIIRSLRPKLPINATVLVVSPADLTLADKAEQKAQSQAVAQALRDVEEVTRLPAPVYLLLAKIDLVPGFREFFDRQEPQERSQPWGFMLPFSGLLAAQSEDDKEAAIGAGFLNLLAAMRMRHIEWLSREADPVRCGRIQGFGAQVAALQQTIKPMLEAILPGQSRTWKGSVLRGVFLNSARQELLSIDALLPELSRRFAMPRIGTMAPDLGLEEEEHGYFVNGTFTNAIFPEAGLIVREQRSGWRGAAQWAAIAAIVAACAGAAYFTFQVFDEETRLVARVTELTAGRPALANPSTIAALPGILAELKWLTALKSEIGATAPVWEYAQWLSGRPLLEAGMDAELKEFRANALAPHLSAMIETQLVDADADASRLTALLELAEEAGKPDSPVLQAWLEDSSKAMPESDRQLLVAEGLAATRETGGLTIDADYIDAARRIIAHKESPS